MNFIFIILLYDIHIYIDLLFLIIHFFIMILIFNFIHCTCTSFTRWMKGNLFCHENCLKYLPNDSFVGLKYIFSAYPMSQLTESERIHSLRTHARTHLLLIFSFLIVREVQHRLTASWKATDGGRKRRVSFF